MDSGASMHMIRKKDLNDAEMDILTKSCSPTNAITANGEVQTHEEATVYVKELDIFLSMKVLENTPSVLSFGKLCDENGYSYEWINGQKPHLIKTVFEYNVIRRTSFRSWFQACQQVLRLLHQLQQYQATVRFEKGKDLSGIDSHPVLVSSSHDEEIIERVDLLVASKPTKTK